MAALAVRLYSPCAGAQYLHLKTEELCNEKKQKYAAGALHDILHGTVHAAGLCVGG